MKAAPLWDADGNLFFNVTFKGSYLTTTKLMPDNEFEEMIFQLQSTLEVAKNLDEIGKNNTKVETAFIYAPTISPSRADNKAIGPDRTRVSAILVKPGQIIGTKTEIFELEQDKAMFAIPAEKNGRVLSVLVNVGDEVATGDPLLAIEEL